MAPDAEACGCVSPPVPSADEAYGVNQQSEQIIFETEPGFVTAHVLIRYAGDPSQFAWIVPVPAVPELALSESLLFGLLDNASAPIVNAFGFDECPSPEFTCMYHQAPNCGSSSGAGGGNFGSTTSGSVGSGGAGGGSADPDGVDVKKKEQIGAYDTVVFGAGDAQAAVDWLQSEGFIVNDSMTPYMQPYLDANMLFVAAKLIPGAGAEEIKPLKMRYAATNPMIPLQLTAVAAEPNLTVTSYVFGEQAFVPDGHPLVTIDETDLSFDGESGRNNYPMLVAKAIDDAGHDGFVMEYAGAVPRAAFQNEDCCQSENDNCFIGQDTICQCPNREFDQLDCSEQEGLVESVTALETLQATHGKMTRLTTRLSPEEMTFDPGFKPVSSVALNGPLILSNSVSSLANCEDDVIDTQAYAETQARQLCSTVYCGAGECVVTAAGAGCLCEPGFVGRSFTDLDGQTSVTCVPDAGTVDFSDGGNLILPDACVGVQCGEGACIDVGGFPSCACGAGSAAVADPDSSVPVCASVTLSTGSRGADNYSAPLAELAVCAPTPYECAEYGWLVPNENKTKQGVICASSMPDPAATIPPPKPTCGDDDDDGPGSVVIGGGSGKGCSCTVAGGDGDEAPVALLLMSLLGVGAWRRRRRARV